MTLVLLWLTLTWNTILTINSSNRLLKSWQENKNPKKSWIRISSNNTLDLPKNASKSQHWLKNVQTWSKTSTKPWEKNQQYLVAFPSLLDTYNLPSGCVKVHFYLFSTCQDAFETGNDPPRCWSSHSCHVEVLHRDTEILDCQENRKINQILSVVNWLYNVIDYHIFFLTRLYSYCLRLAIFFWTYSHL